MRGKLCDDGSAWDWIAVDDRPPDARCEFGGGAGRHRQAQREPEASFPRFMPMAILVVRNDEFPRSGKIEGFDFPVRPAVRELWCPELDSSLIKQQCSLDRLFEELPELRRRLPLNGRVALSECKLVRQR